MSRIEMIAPEGLTGLTITGSQIEILDGVATVEESKAAELVAHGFRRKVPEPLSSVRSTLLNALKLSVNTVLENLSDDVIRSLNALSDDQRSDLLKTLRSVLEGYPSSVLQKQKDRMAEEKSFTDKLAADAAAKLAADAAAKLAADQESISKKK